MIVNPEVKPHVTRNVFIIFTMAALPLLSLQAQNLHLIKGYKHKLKSAEGVPRFALLNDLAWEYRFAYPDSTIYFGKEALELGLTLQMKKGIARSINFIGLAYNYKGDRLQAFDFYQRALQVATEQNDSLQIAHSNNNIGRLFYDQGMLAKSYQYFINAQNIFQTLNDSSGLAYSLQSLANLHKLQNNYPKAESHLIKAYKIRLALGNSRDIMSALVHLGKYYQEANRVDKSIQYFELADSAGNVIQDEINLAEIKSYLAEAFMAKGALDKADAMCREGLTVIVRKNNLRMMPQAFNTMGQILLKKGNLPAAKYNFIKALEIASRIKDISAKMESHCHLTRIYEIEQNENKKLLHHNQYLVLKDSIKNLDLARKVERFQFKMDIERKERSLELLTANNEKNAAVIQQQKLQNIVLVIIILFVSTIGLLQWRNNNKRMDIYQKLQLQNSEIESQKREIIHQNEELSKHNHQLSDLNQEKDTLMGIVAHDLKSPLNRIEGIAYLMEMDTALTSEQREYMAMIKNATNAGLHLITDLLDVHMIEESIAPNFTIFDISKFLLDKASAFLPAAETKNIHLHISRVENEEIYADRDYLSRIMDNLLSNAIKFSPHHSAIDVSADRTENEFWICIRDSGPGFSEDDKENLFKKFKKLSARPTAGENSNGLGLAIVKTLVDRMKGNIELTSEKGKGSQFLIRFSQQKQYA